MEPLPSRDNGLGPALSPSSRRQPWTAQPTVASLQSWVSGRQADCTGGNQATPDKPGTRVFYSCPRLLAWAESLRCGSELTQGGPVPRPQHLPPPSLECTASPRAEACPTPVGPERGELVWASPNVPGHIVPRASAGPPSPFVGAGKGISHLLCLKARSAPHSCFCSGCPGSRTHALDRPWCAGTEAQRGRWDPTPPPSISDTGWELQCRGVGQLSTLQAPT